MIKPAPLLQKGVRGKFINALLYDPAPRPNNVDTAVIPAGIAGIQNTGR